jgi:hypothetical protein
MLFVELESYPFTVQLVPLSDINNETFNPTDYLDFASDIQLNTERLNVIARVKTRLKELEGGVKRIMAGHVDRTTGEVFEPTCKEKQKLHCVPFNVGDIILHKYGCRIGRIGITEFNGFAEHHFIRIKPIDIQPYYLLFALRTVPVLRQLPFRETARPGVRKNDIESLRIPRLGTNNENALSSFVQDIFILRKRARAVLESLLDNLNKALDNLLPTEDVFFENVETLDKKTFDPGKYYLELFKDISPSREIRDDFEIIHPSTLIRGETYFVITAKNYKPEGIVPELPRGVSFIKEKNYAIEGDVLLNRIISQVLTPWKATVVSRDLEYIKMYGVDIKKEDNRIKIPVSEDVFILRKKLGDNLSPYYIGLVLNSNFFRNLLDHTMGGSTGMQVLRKSKLENLRIPLLDEQKMDAFSEAYKSSLLVMNLSHKLLMLLRGIYEDIVLGQKSLSTISRFIDKEKKELKVLNSSLEKAEKDLGKTIGAIFRQS